MTKLVAPLLLALPLASLACAPEPDPFCSDTVVARARPGYDLGAVQTYAIASADDYPADLPGDLPDDTKTNLVAANFAVASELVALGMSEVDPSVEEPDVYVFSLAVTDTDTAVEWQCVGDWVWWGWWGWVWDSCAWLEAIEIEYEVGSVIVGLADPTAEAVVFGGVVQGALACGDGLSRVETGVARIFDEWPG